MTESETPKPETKKQAAATLAVTNAQDDKIDSAVALAKRGVKGEPSQLDKIAAILDAAFCALKLQNDAKAKDHPPHAAHIGSGLKALQALGSAHAGVMAAQQGLESFQSLQAKADKHHENEVQARYERDAAKVKAFEEKQ